MTGDSIAGIIRKAFESRATSATSENDASSRSHAVLTLNVERQGTDADGKSVQTESKIRFVDLAGSEKDQGRAQETKAINQSLSTLCQCLKKLTKKNPGHVPYRDSKLTMLLEDALGGTSKCVMIACVRSDDKHASESINTLRFAKTAKEIKKKKAVKKRTKVSRLAALRVELENVKQRMEVERSENASKNAKLDELYRVMSEDPFNHSSHMRQLIKVKGGDEEYVEPEIDCFMNASLRMAKEMLMST